MSDKVPSPIRQRLMSRFPPPASATTPDKQVGHAFYFMLHGLEEKNFVVDGWSVFKVTAESHDSLEALGLMTLLPHGSIPMTVRVATSGTDVTWTAQASVEDERWKAMSDRKRWNDIYLMASGERAGPTPWEWDRHYSGTLTLDDTHA